MAVAGDGLVRTRRPGTRTIGGRLGVALALTLGLAACHRSGPDTTGKANAAGLVPIRVAGAEGINSASPLFVAERQGFFKEAGLEVTYTSMASGASAMAAALKAGEIDVGLGAATQWMSDTARGAIQGKIIGEFTDNNYVIIGGDGIGDVRQLKGKIFAISSRNGGDHLYSQAVLAHYGISPDDVTWLALGEPASRLSALLTNRVQATEIPITTLPVDARKRILVSADASPVPFVSNAIYVRQPLLDANRAALSKFLAAIGRGADWIRQHPAEAVPACTESGTSEAGCKVAIEVGTTSKNPYTWSSTTRVNADGIAAMIPIVAAVVPQARTMKVADIVDGTVAGGGGAAPSPAHKD